MKKNTLYMRLFFSTFLFSNLFLTSAESMPDMTSKIYLAEGSLYAKDEQLYKDYQSALEKLDKTLPSDILSSEQLITITQTFKTLTLWAAQKKPQIPRKFKARVSQFQQTITGYSLDPELNDLMISILNRLARKRIGLSRGAKIGIGIGSAAALALMITAGMAYNKKNPSLEIAAEKLSKLPFNSSICTIREAANGQLLQMLRTKQYRQAALQALIYKTASQSEDILRSRSLAGADPNLIRIFLTALGECEADDFEIIYPIMTLLTNCSYVSAGCQHMSEQAVEITNSKESIQKLLQDKNSGLYKSIKSILDSPDNNAEQYDAARTWILHLYNFTPRWLERFQSDEEIRNEVKKLFEQLSSPTSL